MIPFDTLLSVIDNLDAKNIHDYYGVEHITGLPNISPIKDSINNHRPCAVSSEDTMIIILLRLEELGVFKKYGRNFVKYKELEMLDKIEKFMEEKYK